MVTLCMLQAHLAQDLGRDAVVTVVVPKWNVMVVFSEVIGLKLISPLSLEVPTRIHIS